jgi:predicted glycosyl hydrolase (DUF1957 family)
MIPTNIHYIWQIHQPFFIEDEEVNWRIHSTYIPLVDALIDRNIPFSLNITGSTLDRIATLCPEFITEIREKIQSGMITFLGSAAFHPILPWLPTKSALAQIHYDREIKNRLDLKVCNAFWPTELAWSTKAGFCAISCGYDYVVIDSCSRDLIDRVPMWQNDGVGLKPVKETLDRLGNTSKLKTHISLSNEQKPLTCLVRERGISNEILKQMIGEEETASIHLENVLNSIEFAKNKALDPKTTIIIAEDAERFLPNYLTRFLDLLDEFQSHGINFTTLNEVVENGKTIETEHIPASTMEGDDRMWLMSVDDYWFRSYLEQVTLEAERKIDFLDPPSEKEEMIRNKLLSIQDSGFYFWHYVSRTRKPFYDVIFDVEKELAQIG